MRFIITVASYYPVVGGVQIATQNVAEELVRQGHKVTILISKPKENSNIFELNGVQLEYWNLHTEKDHIIGDKNNYIEYIKSISSQIDVLICVCVHSALTDVLLPIIQEIQCKKVLYLHGIYDFGWSKKDKSSITRILSKIYYNSRRRPYYARLFRYAKHFDLIVHLSENDASMQYMKKHQIGQNIVIYNSANPAFFEPPETECNAKYFLQVANYAEHKNQEFSLKAYYESGCRDIEMVYIGSDRNAYYDFLLRLNDELAKRYGERNVRFLYGLSRGNTIEMFKHAKAMILSSRVEKFPMVLVEGLACGVPFISTDCGCVRGLPCGKVVHSVHEMALNMTNICVNSTENHLANKAKQYAKEKFSLKQNVKVLCDALKE